MSQHKGHIRRLAEIMAAKGVTHVVVSPGSRNAPAVIIFSGSKKLKLTSIADERSAGFYALGMAQQLKQPVAVICTSGSAAVNYGPAISEAYYQKIPLLVITADRPQAWIDQGDGQTIRQEGLFRNFIRKSYNLPEYINDDESVWYFERIVNDAVDYCNFPVPGPVHVNLPLAEPLYEIVEFNQKEDVRIINIVKPDSLIEADQLKKLAEIWNNAEKKMILAGQFAPGESPEHRLQKLAADPSVVVLTETTSNLKGEGYMACIDRVIEGVKFDNREFVPDLLLTIGGAVISKKIKALLRKMKPKYHWHVSPDPGEFHFDTYQSLTHTIPVEPVAFLNQLAQVAIPNKSTFNERWKTRNNTQQKKHRQFLQQTEYTDLKVFEYLFKVIPEGTHIHLGNSTPVRYAQLFEHQRQYKFWSNRGASGIDGCVSTAVGAASVTSEFVTAIVGDISLFYDSNALWNRNLSPNFRVIMINNGGGNIFRIIPGPDKYSEMEPYLETVHSFHAKGIAENFGLRYYRTNNLNELEKVINEFYADTGNAALLEIVTPGKESAETLRNYFKNLI